MKRVFFLTLILNTPRTTPSSGLAFTNAALEGCLVDERALCSVVVACFSDAIFVSAKTVFDDRQDEDRKIRILWVLEAVFKCFKDAKSLVLQQTTRDVTYDFERLGVVENRVGYLVIVWNKRALLGVLRQGKFRRVFPNSQLKYLVVYVGRREPQRMLMEAWIEYQTFRVTSYEVCNPGVVYVLELHGKLNTTVEKVKEINFTEIKSEDVLSFSVNNYREYPLRVVMFARKPTAIRTEFGYKGLDGRMIEHLAKFYNFEIIYSESNKSFAGSVDDIVNKRADLAGNGMFLTDYGTDQYDFTSPYWNTYLCFVVPKARKVPKWLKPFYLFTLTSWICIVCMYFFFLTVWNLIEFVLNTVGRNPGKASWVQLFQFFTTQPTNLPYFSQIERAFIACCIIFCVIITGTFHGGLFTSYSTPTYSPDINTLEDLFQSNLLISTDLDIFRSDSELKNRFANKLVPTEGASLERTMHAKDVASLERSFEAQFLIKTKYVGEDGEPLLHIVGECLVSQFLAYMVPKGSPFLSDFNKAIGAFVEAGLTKKWVADAMNEIRLHTLFHNRTFKSEGSDAFSVWELQLAFLVLGVGLVAAFGVFLGELMVKKYHQEIELVQ